MSLMGTNSPALKEKNTRAEMKRQRILLLLFAIVRLDHGFSEL